MNINTIPYSQLPQLSKIALEPCETEYELYFKVALEVLDVIQKNNENGKPTIMVVPYGPVGPYKPLAHLVNKNKISLKNCVFINMDEYLIGGRYIDKENPLSFRGGMERTFYSKVEPELNVLEENRCFPDPLNTGGVLELINKYGKLDMVWGGVGINGHYAFNEPPEPGEVVSAEEFLERGTRVLKISRETRTINSVMNCGGNIEGIPEDCITVGMKEMYMAKKVCMCMPRDWNAGALRKVILGEVSAQVPCSLFQNHTDAKLFATVAALQCPEPEIRIYNK